MTTLLLTFAIAHLAAAAIVNPPGARYRVMALRSDDDPLFMNSVVDFNDSVEVVGHGAPFDGPYFNEIYVWDPVMGARFLGDLPGGRRRSENPSINNLGHICGTSSSEFGDNDSFFWSPDTGFMNLGDLPGGDRYALANGINDHDEVVGVSRCSFDPLTDTCAFIWDQTRGMRPLGDLPGGQIISVAYDINNSSEAVGWSASEEFNPEAFIWDEVHGMRPLDHLPDGSYALQAYAINNLGQVTGSATGPDGLRAFVWSEVDGLVILPAPPGFRAMSRGFDINDRGEVCGVAGYSCCPHVAFGMIWDPVNDMRNINELLAPGTAPQHAQIVNCQKINNHGQILTYSSEPIILTPYLPGDLDEDGVVDLADLARLMSRYGTAEPEYTDGDIDADGDVDFRDLVWLLDNFGQMMP